MNPEPAPLEAKTATLARMAVALLVGPLAAYAPAALSYVGPGAGLGMIASLLRRDPRGPRDRGRSRVVAHPLVRAPQEFRGERSEARQH